MPYVRIIDPRVFLKRAIDQVVKEVEEDEGREYDPEEELQSRLYGALTGLEIDVERVEFEQIDLFTKKNVERWVVSPDNIYQLFSQKADELRSIAEDLTAKAEVRFETADEETKAAVAAGDAENAAEEADKIVDDWEMIFGGIDDKFIFDPTSVLVIDK